MGKGKNKIISLASGLSRESRLSSAELARLPMSLSMPQA